MTDLIFADGAQGPAAFVLQRINRHGLITGATGTGKTVTLQTLAEGMAKAGIPAFVTDVKGDLSGIAVPKAPQQASQQQQQPGGRIPNVRSGGRVPNGMGDIMAKSLLRAVSS